MRIIKVKPKVILLKEAREFLQSIPEVASVKLLKLTQRVEEGEINSRIFKKLEDSDYWEFRLCYEGIQYRLFAFWDRDEETLIVATHGIIKKTQKTPRKAIKRISIIEKNYFQRKK